MQKNPGITRDKLLPLATLHNVRQSVDQLLERSEVIRQLSASGKLLLTGAVYDIRTGKVDFEDVAHMAIQEDGRTVATTGRTENGVHATFARK